MSSSRRHNQLAMNNSSKATKRRRRLLTAAALLSPAAAQTTTVAAQEPEHACPPDLNGWSPSTNCEQYYWCSGGSLASMAYDCPPGTLFDSLQLTCLEAGQVECEGRTTTTTTVTTTEGYTWTETPTAQSTDPPAPSKGSESKQSNLQQMSGSFKKSKKSKPPSTPSPSKAPTTKSPTATPTTSSPTVSPTPRPTFLGDPIYFPDFPSRSCTTENPPQWLKPEEMYTTKEECCTKVMNWIPLEQCLGEGYIETNYYWSPTKSPSISPSKSPSAAPSKSPSFEPTVQPSDYPTYSPSSSEPTETPSMEPTKSPNNSPTYSPSHSPSLSPTEFESTSPSLSPTTGAPTEYPTLDPKIVMSTKLESASKVQESYLVDLIGWANEGMETFSTQAFSNTFSTDIPSTPSDIIESFDSQVSELMLPVSDDATISKQRPNLNFGDHQALAVDGGDPSTTIGDSNGETFDSLLKFDVSLIDSSRAVESLVLKLYAIEGCKSGGTFYTTSSTSWESNTITWQSAPTADGEWLASLSTIPTSQWIEVDITKALAWHDAASAFLEPYISIRIESNENSRCLYSSMESGDSVSPRMVVKYVEQAIVKMSESYQSEEASPSLSPPVIGDFILLKATDDATVVGSRPSNNFGSEPNLLIAFDSYTRDIFDSLIRFDLTELVSTPARTAVLSLFSESECVSAGTFTTTSGSSEWSEDTVTWSNAPMHEPGTQDGTSLGIFGAVQAHEWNAFNVLPAINNAVKQGKNSVTFRISSGNLNPCQFTSRNGGRAPKLMVAF